MALTAASGQRLYHGYMTVMKRTTDGYPAGSAADPESLTNDTTYDAYLVKHTVSFDPGVAANPRVRDVSGGTVRSSQFLPKTDLGLPVIVLSQEDETLISTFMKNNAVDVSYNTAWAIRDDNPGQSVFPDLIVGLHAYVQRVESSGIVNYWDNWFYLNCQLQEASAGVIQQITGDVDNPSPLTYNLAISNSDRSVFGTLISALGTSNETGEAALQQVRSLKRIHTALYVDDGVAGTATLGYRPTSSEITGAAENNVTKNGTQTAITSISTTTAVAVFTAGAATDKWVFCPQTNFVTP
jgi:hypothetical protein